MSSQRDVSSVSEEELVALERQGWDSLCQRRGGRFYGELMTADAVMVLVNGEVWDRERVAGSLDAAPEWSEYELSDVRRVDLGECAAALVYRARAGRAGQEPFTALMTSVYRRDGDRLRLALYQQTSVPDGA